ncbi:hypothetical protein ACDF64_10295 [Agromyces sp. MMS24-JH15]|uniref:hypothetical protein n=1 Tax=Agromyces sp. MMS24-JH15 TaxID=3243765 RepID=UPI003747BFD2
MNAGPAQTWLGVGAALSAVTATVIFIVTGSPAAGAIGFVGTAAATIVAYRVGVRGILSALLILLVGPGLLGETSIQNSLIGMLGLLAVCLSYRHSNPTSTGAVLLVVGFILMPGIGMLSTLTPVAAVYGVAATIGGLAMSRPQFADDLLTGLTWVMGALAASYAATYFLGQFATPLTTFHIDTRTFALHAPFTITTGGEPFIPGTRRLTPLTGEPGLAAFYAAPLIAVVFGAGVSVPRRTMTSLVLAALVIFSQSFATLLAVGGAVSAGILVVLWRRRHRLFTALLALVVLLVAPAIIGQALDEKAMVAPASFTDRGIADLGDASAASFGTINLLVTFGRAPVLAATLVVALLLGLVYAMRTLAGSLAFLAFATIVIFAQPSQWHPAAWLLVGLAMRLAEAKKLGKVNI